MKWGHLLFVVLINFNSQVETSSQVLRLSAEPKGLKLEVQLAGGLGVVHDALKHENNHFICHA